MSTVDMSQSLAPDGEARWMSQYIRAEQPSSTEFQPEILLGAPLSSSTPSSPLDSDQDAHENALPDMEMGGVPASSGMVPDIPLGPGNTRNMAGLPSFDTGGGPPWSAPIVPSNIQTGLRRKRDNDDDGDRLQGRLPGHHLRNFAAQQAAAGRLDAEQTKMILEFSELRTPEMLISLHVKLIMQHNELCKRMLRFYVRHGDFVLRLRNYIAAALLAADVRAYVKGVLAQMMTYFEKNLDTLALLPNTREDPVDWQLFRSSVSDELSNQRSWMKTKLDASILNKQDIYQLTESILIYGIKARTLHFARFTFLRKCALDFKRLPPSKRGNGKFWEFVDNRLAHVRAITKEGPVADRKLREAEIFAAMLAEDQQMFSPSAGALMRQTYNDEEGHDWQRAMEKTVRGFVVDDDEILGGGAAAPEA